jgi:uncharacterized membrane protein YraQ (UPF0718 family)
MVNLLTLIFKEFLNLLLRVFPYFLIGAGFGALLKTYVKPEWTLKYFGKATSSVINACILGAVLPGCSCATMPMAEGIKSKGVKVGVLTAFIMISPLLSPVTVFLTFGLLGLKIGIARIVFPFIGSIAVGVILNYLEMKKVFGFAIPASEANAQVCTEPCEDSRENYWQNLIAIFKNLTKYFLLGMFVAAVLAILIPEGSLSKYINPSGILAYLTAALIGIPLYVCEGEEVPLTYALLKVGLGVGPAFTFLLGSVGTCIPTMLMAPKVIGRRATIFYVASWFIFAIGSGMILGLIK